YGGSRQPHPGGTRAARQAALQPARPPGAGLTGRGQADAALGGLLNRLAAVEQRNVFALGPEGEQVAEMPVVGPARLAWGVDDPAVVPGAYVQHHAERGARHHAVVAGPPGG